MLRVRFGGCAGSKPTNSETRSGMPPKVVAQQPQLTAAQLRYSTISVLRTLLMHDSARGGVPIRLVSARWLLTFFQANAGARLLAGQVV